MSDTSFPNEPALLTGATAAWRAHRRWTPEFLANLPDEALSLTDADGEPAGDAGLAAYLAALRDGAQPLASRYASGWRFFERHPDMLADFSEPPQACPDLLQTIPPRLFKPLLWIFIGAQGSGTGLHYDVLDTHAWLAVISGRKRIALHPPARFDDYAARRGDALAVLGARRAHGRWRYLELAPGDLLLIPSGWWHEVVNEGVTVGLTRNFATPDIHQRVAAAARRQGLTPLRAWLEPRDQEVLS